jgi:hypothetical protein
MRERKKEIEEAEVRNVKKRKRLNSLREGESVCVRERERDWVCKKSVRKIKEGR